MDENIRDNFFTGIELGALGAMFESVFTGVIEFITRVNSDTLEGMMVFDGSGVATVSGTYNGGQYEFTIDLKTFEVST